jgi:hypothetical protein
MVWRSDLNIIEKFKFSFQIFFYANYHLVFKMNRSPDCISLHDWS